MIRSQKTLFSCYDDFPLHTEIFEPFNHFRLIFHQVDIPISAQIICEGEKITIPAMSLNIHLHDQIAETLFTCYDDFTLHSETL